MSTVIMLIGPPGSGKTTFRNQYLKNIPVVSTDDLLLRIATETGKTYTEAFNLHYKECEARYRTLTNLYQNNDQTYIIDRTNLTRKSRAKTLAVVPSRYTKVAITMPIYSIESLMLRINKRPDQPIAESIVRDMVRTYRWPNTDEGFNLILSAIEVPRLLEGMVFK